MRKSPEWVTKLEAAKDAEQLIVVAGVDKTTAYVTMHEKNADGEWEQIIATLYRRLRRRSRKHYEIRYAASFLSI